MQIGLDNELNVVMTITDSDSRPMCTETVTPDLALLYAEILIRCAALAGKNQEQSDE